MAENFPAAWPVTLMIQEGLVLLVDRIDENQESFLPEELPFTERMTSGRVREFRAGRTLARRALRLVGNPSSAVIQGSDGEPIWPEGIVGSLSHTSRLVAALVTHQSKFRAVGVDLNDRRPLGDATAAQIMSALDEAAARTLSSLVDLEAIRNMVFSVKEAIFKCQFPLTQCSDLDFGEVDLEAQPGSNFFSAKVKNRPLIAEVVHGIRIFPMNIQTVTGAMAVLPA